MAKGRLRSWWNGVKLGLAVVASALVVLWLTITNRRARRLDKQADEAENEASRVRDAGQRGAADEVLDSFRRATKK